MKENKAFRFLYTWIAVLLAASFVLQIPVCAESAAGKATVPRESTGEEKTTGTPSEKDRRMGTKTPAETEIQVFIQDAGPKKQDAVTVKGLRITVEKETEEAAIWRREGEEASDSQSVPELYESAAVTTAEGIVWEIPLFWMDDSNMLAEKKESGRIYKPVLAFFVPDEYVVQEDTANGFTVTLDAFLSGLYERAGGAVCFYEPNTNITYIAAAGADLSFLEKEEEKLPAEPVPGLPDDLRKPADGTYHNPSLNTGGPLPEEGEESGKSSGIYRDRKDQNTEKETEQSGNNDGPGTGNESSQTDESDTGDSSSQTDEPDTGDSSSQTEEPSKTDSDDKTEEEPEQEEEETPLTREQLLAHCAGNTLNKYGEDEMADLVNLIITCIQPQAVALIKSKFPAFAEAAEEDALGKEIGLYVYRMFGEKDGVKAHADASSRALAYVSYHIDEDDKGRVQLGYILGLNTFYFQCRDEEGNLQIDRSEQAVSNLDNSIIHEMFHAFMCDYNRTGTIGTPDPEDYLHSGKELKDIRNVYEFPGWFKEGIASAVENNYQYRYEYFQLLRYEGDGTIGSRHTPENLLNTYLTRLFLLEDDVEYEDSYDIGAEEATSTSMYVTGYLAALYLGELAARQNTLSSSLSVDGNGSTKISSETIRLGLNSILERLHKGETLDQVICSISDGRYRDVSDFEQKFIKGADQKGDQDSISFCVDFLNYMQDIGTANTYIPNGSILFDFDRDFTTPIDRSVTLKTDLYRITDSSDYTASTAILETPYTDGGKSAAQDPQGDAAGKSTAGIQKALQSAKENSPLAEGEYSALPDGNDDAAEDISDPESAADESAELTGREPSAEAEAGVRQEEGQLTDREPAECSEENSLPENEPAECSEEYNKPENEPGTFAEESPLPENEPGEYSEENPFTEDETAD